MANSRAKTKWNKAYYWRNWDYYAKYRRDYYKKNKERVLAVNRANRETRYVAMRQAKDRPCVDCGGRFHHAAMDFDHVRGVKTNCVARMNVSLRKMLAEMDKCEVVCANCHRVRTWKRKHGEL